MLPRPTLYNMRNLIVALLAVTAFAATAVGQQPPGRRREVSFQEPVARDEKPRDAASDPDEPADTVGDTEDEDPETDETSEDPETDPFAGPIHERSKLTGDWLGWRSIAEKRGVTFDISSTQYYQGVTTGGLEQAFNFGGRNDYFLNLDGEKLGFHQGTSLTLHGETRYGESANTLGGTLAAPNLLLSVPLPTGSVTALTGVTLTQVLSDELEFYAGKFNTLDDFEQPLTGAGSLTGFLNTAMLYNPVFARTIPYSTFGAGFSCLEEEETVFSLVVYDTNDSPTTSGFDTFFDNGVTVYTEFIRPTDFCGRPGHQGISGTYSNGEYTNLEATAYLDPIEGLIITSTPIAGSWSLAYNFDQALYVSPDDPERMWGVFGNLGIADNNPSPVRWFASFGVSGASPFAGRDGDSFGIGSYYLGVSESLKDLAPVLLPLRDEYGVEMYYNMAVTPWWQITPDLQVIAPFRDRADTSLICGLRVNVDF